MIKYMPIKTIIQAFEILDVLEEHEKLGVSGIARATNLPKSTVCRYLRTLRDLNIVIQDHNDMYALGYHLLKYQNQLKWKDVFVKHIQPFMHQLVICTGEAVNVGVLVEQKICILHTEYGQQYRLQTELTHTASLHSSSIGKLFLETFSNEKLKAYFEMAEARTMYTKTKFHDFKKELMMRRHPHIALSCEEYEYGLMCIATPIFDGTGQMRAALSISGPKSRLLDKGLEEIQTALLNEARNIMAFLNRIEYWSLKF
ncbi:IclR family transcriptional regulator [Staphylococcus lutrae]|uniref:Transcriptional regulator n=1 Tax=Staphylococcus lutrae TaxID=155085 RepID=A0AAC9RR70_9STAP|nr:IclR family transcriptional regulator [Staphylococcus lutrae]ARJ50803.1 transcriptional regulator [Staphylococcus lutrae]PNZ39762.1 IclR family transcriptional regulator [Staphylococcus lutrae]